MNMPNIYSKQHLFWATAYYISRSVNMFWPTKGTFDKGLYIFIFLSTQMIFDSKKIYVYTLNNLFYLFYMQCIIFTVRWVLCMLCLYAFTFRRVYEYSAQNKNISASKSKLDILPNLK